MAAPAGQPLEALVRKSCAAPSPSSQLEEISTLIRTLEGADADTDWRARARELAGVRAELLTKMGAEILIEKLQRELAATVEEDE